MASTPSTTVVQRVRRRGRGGGRRSAPAALEVDEQPAAVVGQRDLGPRLLVGQVGEARRVVGGGVAEAVPPHGAVVAGLVVADLVGVGVARVGEAAAVGEPRHRRGAGVGEGVGEQRAGGDVEDPERRALVAAGRRAEGDQRAVGRRLVPVDRGGDLAAGVGRIDQHAAGAVDRLGDRADHERGAVAVAPPVDREELVAADRGRRRRCRPAVSSASRARNRPRAGTASRAVRVRSFWAVVQARTSAEEPSSSQRYGSATSMPWRISTMSSTRVARRAAGPRSGPSATSCGRGWACGRGWPSSCEPGGWPSSCAST